MCETLWHGQIPGVQWYKESLLHPHLGGPLATKRLYLHHLGRGWVSKHCPGHPGTGRGAELPGQSKGLPSPETQGVGRRGVNCVH